MAYIVDIQGFQGPCAMPPHGYDGSNKFIAKEIAIIKVPLIYSPDNQVETLLIQPPYPWENLPDDCVKTNEWIIKHLHGIPWNEGTVPFDILGKVLLAKLYDAEYIFVKGLEKQVWLDNQLSLKKHAPIINLEDMGCPALPTLRMAACSFKHMHKDLSCATQNGRYLRLWFLEKYGDSPSEKKSLELLQHVNSLKDLSKHDIAALSMEFILTHRSHEISDAWHKLPNSYKRDYRFIDHYLCWEHFPKPGDPGDHIDGPPPSKKQCPGCRRHRNK